jgi:hypothetical protein
MVTTSLASVTAAMTPPRVATAVASHRSRTNLVYALLVVFYASWNLVIAAAPTHDPPADSVSALIARNPSHGLFTVSGFVAKLFICPSCPPGANCKPCMGDNIVLSEDNRVIESYEQLGSHEVIIFATPSQVQKFRVGNYYRIRVEVLPNRTTSMAINNLRMVQE